MKSPYFDAIFIGSSLASRIAAFLIGRRGRRVLVLGGETPPAPLPPDIPCCQYLEKLLRLLRADDGMVHPAAALQLISEKHRLDLTGRPLEEEWRRETNAGSDAAAQLLHWLDTWGTNLSRALVTGGPSPLFSRRARFRLALSHRRPGRCAWPPALSLTGLLERHVDREANRLLQDLFSGLSGLPAAAITPDQAALLWHWAGLPRAVARRGLTDLLTRRTAQFHVTEMPLEELATPEWKGGRPDGVILKDGTHIRTSRFIIGTADGANSLPFKKNARRKAAGFMMRTWQTGPIRGNLSPLLGDRIVLSDALPLCLERIEDAGQVRFLIRGSLPSQNGEIDPEHIKQRLLPLLPFTHFSIEEVSGALPVGATHSRRLSPVGLPCIPPGRNVITAIPDQMCPGLGVNGEILLGFAIADLLQPPVRT